MSRPPFWLAALVIWPIFWPIFGCATSKSSESQLQLSGKEETQTETREIAVQRVQTGPETITTTVEEWKSGVWESNPSIRFGRPTPRPLGQPRPDSLSPEPVLVKRTVTVDQRGPSTSETSLNGRTATERSAQTEVIAKVKETSKTRWGPPWWAYALIAGVLAALAAAAWHFKPPFLSFLWKLL